MGHRSIGSWSICLKISGIVWFFTWFIWKFQDIFLFFIGSISWDQDTFPFARDLFPWWIRGGSDPDTYGIRWSADPTHWGGGSGNTALIILVDAFVCVCICMGGTILNYMELYTDPFSLAFYLITNWTKNNN